MRDTQTKVITILSHVAEINGLELLNDKQFGNTGTLRVEVPTSLEPLLNIGYSFQDDYSTFSVRPAHGLGLRGNGDLFHVGPDELQKRFIEPVVEIIDKLGYETAKTDSGVRRARERRAIGIKPG